MSPSPRPRRNSAEVRALIVRAASDAFLADGFDRASIAKIAERAGVPKATVFRHFGTKDGLYEQVVLSPLVEFLSSFVAGWDEADVSESADVEVTRAYMQGLLSVVRENRPLFSMLTRDRPDDRFSRSSELVRRTLAEHLAAVDRNSRSQARRQNAKVMDFALAVRFSTALALGLGLLEDVLFDDSTPIPSMDVLSDQLARFVVRGTTISEI